MTLIELYDYAAAQNITVINRTKSKKKAFCTTLNKDEYIMLNLARISTEGDERLVLAEEVGHCMSNAFYTLVSFPAQVSRAESRARAWKVKLLITLSALRAAIIKSPLLCDIAEELEVDEPTAQAAIDYYRRKKSL